MAYYVKMDDPREFRRDLLESSKKVIGCLQANRNVLEIRRKKRVLLDTLLGQVKELALLMSKLDDVLPDKQLREEALQEERLKDEIPQSETKSFVKEEVVSSPLVDEPSEPLTSEDQALDSALSSIEEKLSHLD